MKKDLYVYASRAQTAVRYMQALVPAPAGSLPPVGGARGLLSADGRRVRVFFREEHLRGTAEQSLVIVGPRDEKTAKIERAALARRMIVMHDDIPPAIDLTRVP